MAAFHQVLDDAHILLTEGSMYERLRRDERVAFDPDIAHAAHIYGEASARLLADTHREYIDVARRAGLPMLLSSSTWRASAERIARSAYAGRAVNEDNVAFLRELRDEAQTPAPLVVAGVLGPRGDAYRPDESPDRNEAERFHSAQAQALARGGAEVLVAMTLPALPEARGMARALAATGLPWLLSFVVRDDGTLLDGTPLAEALDRLDVETDAAPVGYLINCVHPTILEEALAHAPGAAARILGLKANTSAKRPEELDRSDALLTEDPEVLGAHLERLRQRFGFKVMGGCCGTGTEHIAQIASGGRHG